MIKQGVPGAVVPAGQDRLQGHRTVFGGMQIDFKVLPKETRNGLLVVENTNPSKGGPPRHLHHAQEEWFYVVEGQYIIEVGHEKYTLGPGASLLAPRAVPHVWAHVGDGTGRLLVTFQPAGKMQAFFERASEAKGPLSAEATRDLFRAHGMEVVGPPLSLVEGKPVGAGT